MKWWSFENDLFFYYQVPLWENRVDFPVHWTLIIQANKEVYQMFGVLNGLSSPLIHMVVLYETDAGLLRFGGLKWNPHWRENLLANQIEEFLPWLHDGSIHRCDCLLQLLSSSMKCNICQGVFLKFRMVWVPI